MSGESEPAPRSGRGVYGITVTAELSGVAIQSLRLYERFGLLTPSRTAGGTRRYSDDDLIRLQRITALVGAGINLAGIARILELEDANTALAADNATLRAERTSHHGRATPTRRPGRGSDRAEHPRRR